MHASLLSRFIFWYGNPRCALIQPHTHTCACNMCIIMSYVIHWQFRLIDHNGSHKPASVLSSQQCRINNSSKCSNCYGPRAFGGPAVLCIEFFVIICNGGYKKLGARGKLSERGPIFYTCYTKTLFAESKFNFSFCLGICFCVKVHFTLKIVWSHLILNCSLSTH